jgi:hypothetical protein
MTADRPGEGVARRPRAATTPARGTRTSLGVAGLSFDRLLSARDKAVYLIAYPAAYVVDQFGPVAHFFEGTPPAVVAGLGGTFVIGVTSLIDWSTRIRRRVRNALRFADQLEEEGFEELATAVRRDAALLRRQVIDLKDFDATMKKIAKRYREES